MSKVCDIYFVESLEIITKKYKISDDVAGATFMAIGSSAPELFIAMIALTKVGVESVGVGTIVGSAIFNILVITGASAWVSKAVLEWKPVMRDIFFYILSLVILIYTFWDGNITLAESLVYVLFYGVYLLVLKNWKSWVPTKERESEENLKEMAEHELEEYEKEMMKKKNFLGLVERFTSGVLKLTFPNLKKKPHLFMTTFAVSILWIALLSWAMVEIGVELAHDLGIPEAIIGLTILAAGTSVPDLLSSVIASKRGYGNMAISNALGSNTFDILIGLGLPWVIYILVKGGDVNVRTESLLSSMILLFATVLLFAFIIIGKKFELSRREGFFLIIIYVLYLSFSVTMALYPDLLASFSF